VLDATTSMDGGWTPKSGDITICLYCGHLMAFDDQLSFRGLTDEEMKSIAGDPRVLAIQKARKRSPNDD
jgi:hypothetical protein